MVYIYLRLSRRETIDGNNWGEWIGKGLGWRSCWWSRGEERDWDRDRQIRSESRSSPATHTLSLVKIGFRKNYKVLQSLPS